MKASIFIVAVAVLSSGCATHQQESVSSIVFSSLPEEKAIYERLRVELIPLPATTPFDSDQKQREVYTEGFDEAWDWVISGTFLHGDRAFTGPTEQEKSWRAGWKDGYKIASDRWMQEFERWRKDRFPQSNSSP